MLGSPRGPRGAVQARLHSSQLGYRLIVPPLDPIVSLSVALAEAPGTCAFFLGSGVSRQAGVPTGQQLVQAGLRRLYQLEEGVGRVEQSALEQWLSDTGRQDLAYSDLLELIAPDPAVRREYLAGFFEGKQPGPAHQALADLAKGGMARVFITTNFDRLLEHALQAQGLEPVVLASDADVEAAMPREHAGCVVIKPHGDYLRQTIRNTPAELAELEPRLTTQLAEVFDRYGLVVLGYSGSDEAIARALRARRSRYGLWWVSRGALGQPAAELVEATGGRVIAREGAEEFLADLDGRLATFEAHPSGHTPATVHDEILERVRAKDEVGLRERLRRESNWWNADLSALVAEHSSQHPGDPEGIRDLWGRALSLFERRLASLLPLALYSSDEFASEVAGLARSLERAKAEGGGYAIWRELPRYGCTWLGYVLGAVLMRLDEIEALSPLLAQTWTDQYGGEDPLVFLPGDLQHALGQALAPDDQSWLSSGWEHLTRSVDECDWLSERYPEMFEEGEPRASMGQFDFLLCVCLVLNEHRALAFYSLAGDAPVQLAMRMHNDAGYRQRVAGAVGTTLEDFDARAVEALADVAGFQGGFADSRRAPAVLAEGRSAGY